MKLQVLVSTMRKEPNEIVPMIQKSNLHADVVVINQCGRDATYLGSIEDQPFQVVETAEIGLSKSRNTGLYCSDGDLCLIADDDMHYESNLEEKIIKGFQENPAYDLIAFYIERGKEFNQIEKGQRKVIKKLQSLSLISVQIAYRRKSILDKNIRFDERFGAGSGLYNSGEENIFLMDCLNAGLKILYLPVKIGDTVENESTWFQGYDEEYFISKGAVFQRLFRYFAIPMIYAFAILKYSLYGKDLSRKQAIHYMNEGRKRLK